MWRGFVRYAPSCYIAVVVDGRLFHGPDTRPTIDVDVEGIRHHYADMLRQCIHFGHQAVGFVPVSDLVVGCYDSRTHSYREDELAHR